MSLVLSDLPGREEWQKGFEDKLALLLNHYRDLTTQEPKVTWDLQGAPADCPRERLGMMGIVPLKSFYYVGYIAEKSSFVYDIGCGSNVFKIVYPNVIGVDPKNSKADIKASFDEEYSITHNEHFPSAIAINSLHFIEIGQFQNRILEFARIIRQTGYGYITFNFDRIAERSGIDRKDYHLYANMLDQKIENLDLDVLHYENNMRERPGDYIDGNISLLFRK